VPRPVSSPLSLRQLLDCLKVAGKVQPLTKLPDGTVIQPTGKSFVVIFSTAARWRNGKIVEEYLFYDNATILRQVGLA
jgi:hypothetical protein